MRSPQPKLNPEFQSHIAQELFSPAGDIEALVEVQVVSYECAQPMVDSIQWTTRPSLSSVCCHCWWLWMKWVGDDDATD